MGKATSNTNRKSSVKRKPSRFTVRKYMKRFTQKKSKIIAQTVYHEGGDCYREIIIVKASQPWPTKNIAFFQSTGRSNVGTENLAGTWFPTLGIQRIHFQSIGGKEVVLVKMAMLNKKNSLLPKQLSDLFIGFIDFLTANIISIKTYYLSTIPQTELPISKKDEIEKYRNPFYKDLNSLLSMIESYFINTDQIKTSIELGNGIWEKDEYFVKLFLQFFAFSNKIIPIHRQPLEIQGQQLPINELNGTPLSGACPISNLHRCKASNTSSQLCMIAPDMSEITDEDKKINDFLTTHDAFIEVDSTEYQIEYINKRDYYNKINQFQRDFNISFMNL